MPSIPWLTADVEAFPLLARALAEPDGLLAAGGDLSPARLIAAYRRGIFPWYEEPRAHPVVVAGPARGAVSRRAAPLGASLRRTLRRRLYTVSADRCFAAVIGACAAPRARTADTWIGAGMRAAYCELHRLGHAHSIETWRDGELVGGLYGIALGRVFFGESMFSRADDASKVALVAPRAAAACVGLRADRLPAGYGAHAPPRRADHCARAISRYIGRQRGPAGPPRPLAPGLE